MFLPSPSKVILQLLCWVVLAYGASAAGGRYDVARIPDSLRQGADAVVRLQSESIEIVDLRKVRITRKLVVTLLSAQAEPARYLMGIRSSLESLDDISANIYNAAGYELSHLRSKDFRPRSANIGSALYSDVVFKELRVDYAVYPFTIELTTSTTQHHTFMLPRWAPQALYPRIRVAVEEAVLTVSAPPYAGLRYLSYLADTPLISQSGDRNEWQWQVHHRPPLRSEPLAVTNGYSGPTVLLATDSVAIAAYAGNAGSWPELGLFVHQLNAGRDELSAEETARVRELTAGLESDRQKVSVLYRYLQKRARYVAIEIGIGGWQTIPAKEVSSNQFGDCKGLSNYLMALLKVAGVRAYPVLISASDEFNPLRPGFPAAYFNHEILCVPGAQDTLWVECTSPDAPAGYLGSFTQDRDALMLTPDGGRIVHTPRLSSTDNQLVRVIYGKLDSNFSCEMKMSARHGGTWCERLKHRVDNMHRADLEQFVAEKFTLPAYSVDKFEYAAEQGAPIPSMTEAVWIRTSTIASLTQKRLFVSPDLMPVALPAERTESPRTTPFSLGNAYSLTDSFVLDIPAGRALESVPQEIHLDSPFGTFDYAVSYDAGAGRLQLLRRIVMNSGTFAAADYNQYLAFMEVVRKSSGGRAVFRNKQP